MNNKDCLYFKLYANCIPVKGANENIICDMERQYYLPIPSIVYDVLLVNENNELTIEELKHYFDGNYDEGIDKFFVFFEERGLGFYTSEPGWYPTLSLDWDSPFEITNAILEIDRTGMQYDINSVLDQLNEIGCQAIEFRFLSVVSIEKIIKFLKEYENSRFQAYVLYLHYADNIVEKDLVELYLSLSRISFIVVYSTVEDIAISAHNSRLKEYVKFTKAPLTISSKEQLSPNNLILNIPSFTEAKKFNLGLNRKVSVDVNGHIKHYPNHCKSFGNVAEKNLIEVIRQPLFQQLWFINNDQIEICRDCQFRYMCPSNSDILEQNGKFYKKDQCMFDPYSNNWIS